MRLFEFEDLRWFPDTIRHGGTDFLRFFFTRTRFYEPAAGVIADLLSRSGHRTITDLCSGSGGNIETVHRLIEEKLNARVRIILTDKYPPAGFRSKATRITYHDKPVDVLTGVPGNKAVLTMFTAIHHFDGTQVEQILKKAAATRNPVAVFDGADRNALTFLGIPLVQPLLFFICTPFIRPFRISRMVFTYLLPLIPMMTIWDGMVSVLRLHDPATLLRHAQSAAPDYAWQVKKLRNRSGFHIVALTGMPAD